MNGKRALQGGTLFVVFTLIGLGIVRSHWIQSKSLLSRDLLASVLKDDASFYRFPNEVDIPLNSKTKIHAVIQYAFDPKLQEAMEALFKSYGPDYGAFVAMDATTGRVLSMVSFSKHVENKENLALQATFPSASVFKVVTAAAAIESQKFSPNTVVSFNGRNHTLYRSNVLKPSITRWTRYITLREAFARSINTVFGKIGAFDVGFHTLRDYAGRFGFNRMIASDLPIQEGHAVIPEDSWGLAQASSGFTRENTMSPLQGALIAAAVVNDGVIMEPYAIQSVYSQDGGPLYLAKPVANHAIIDPNTAEQIRMLMKETVTHGTSQKSFHGFFKKFPDVNVGGKTGSLTGTDPRGRYDWFIGFASKGEQRIAVAALTIHETYWRVKSSYLARRAIETYFQNANRGKDVALRTKD